MSVSIRLQRGGRNKAPFYTIVAADSRRSRDGRFIARLGHYNPLAKGQDVPFSLNEELMNEWLGKGAQLSETVERLLVKFNVGDAKLHEAYKARKASRIKAQEAVAAFQAKREAAKAAKEGNAEAEAKATEEKAAAEASAAEAKAAAEAAAAEQAEAPAAAEEAPAEEPKAE